MDNFKYIKNISDEEGSILLYGMIGDSIDEKGNYVYGINGTAFAYELKYLQDRCKVINVHINSVGGNVLDGYSIVSAILNSATPVNTHIDGLAASIAGVIAVSGKKVFIKDYGTFMVHNPSGGEDKKVLSLVKDTLVTILTNRSKCTPEEMQTMMDKETWFTASEALDKGLVDEIVDTKKKVKIKKSETLYNRFEIYNKLINPTQNMKKVTNTLKLNEEASEDTIVSAIETLAKENSDVKAENESLKNELKAFKEEKEAREKAEKDALVADATAVVNKAIADKKITDEEKDGILANASASRSNLEFVKNMLDKASNKKEAVKVFDLKNVAGKNGAEDRSDWTIRDWETKDSKGLLEMKNNNVDLYNVLFDKFYKKK